MNRLNLTKLKNRYWGSKREPVDAGSRRVLQLSYWTRPDRGKTQNGASKRVRGTILRQDTKAKLVKE